MGLEKEDQNILDSNNQKSGKPHLETFRQATKATSSKLPSVLQKYENSVIGCKISAIGID